MDTLPPPEGVYSNDRHTFQSTQAYHLLMKDLPLCCGADPIIPRVRQHLHRQTV